MLPRFCFLSVTKKSVFKIVVFVMHSREEENLLPFGDGLPSINFVGKTLHFVRKKWEEQTIHFPIRQACKGSKICCPSIGLGPSGTGGRAIDGHNFGGAPQEIARNIMCCDNFNLGLSDIRKKRLVGKTVVLVCLLQTTGLAATLG